MKRRATWIILTCLIVTSLALASCATATSSTSSTTTNTVASSTTTAVKTTTTAVTTTTVATTPATTTPAANTPIYGGTFTILNNANAASNADPTGWDHQMAIALGQASVWGNPYMEKLLVGDIDKYGPRGNNTFAFNLWENVPEQYWGGLLATGWEIQASPLTYTYHLRQGVMFTGNQKIGMAPREMTSADVVYSENRAINRPGMSAAFTWITSITAPDKYTVVWNCNSFYANWAWRFGGTALGQIWAKEAVAAGPTDWKNQVGTGPYILTDFVSGAGATYTRNPNYWGSTTINGKSYQMPFIQTVIYPIIPDESTQISAIRTGKIDWCAKVKTQYAPSLAQSTPALIQKQYLSGVVDFLEFNRFTSPAVKIKSVRQALMIGLDLKTIATLAYNGGDYYSWPEAIGVPGYTPLAQLPAADQQLWNYNPTLAKQMLATAGYPSGFKMEIMVSSGNQQQINTCNAVIAMWAQIGVTATLNIVDQTVLSTASNQGTFKDCVIQNSTAVNPLTTLNLARATYATTGLYHNDPSDTEGLLQEKMYQDMSATVDATQRAAKIQALSIAFMDDASTIGLTNTYTVNCYWPWFKNYYGELDASYYNAMPMIMRGWIDPNVKKSLGK